MPALLYEPKAMFRDRLAAAGTTLYTTPAAKSAIVKNIVVKNTTAGAVLAALYSVESGGAVADDRMFFESTIPAGEQVFIDCSIVLEAGDSVEGSAGADNSITVTMSGQVTQ